MARFMIVDDSIFQRRNLSKMINQMGWEVIAEASNGSEAIEMYPIFRPDLVLMDMLMPEMEGTEAVKKILEIDRNAMIVVISSIGSEDVVDKAIALGAKRFITKPVVFSQAADVIKSVLEGGI